MDMKAHWSSQVHHCFLSEVGPELSWKREAVAGENEGFEQVGFSETTGGGKWIFCLVVWVVFVI